MDELEKIIERLTIPTLPEGGMLDLTPFYFKFTENVEHVKSVSIKSNHESVLAVDGISQEESLTREPR